MGRMVIVIDFEEPDDDMVIGGMIERCQAAAKPLAGSKLHMARAEVAESIIHIFDPIHEGEEAHGTDRSEGSDEGG